MAWEAKVAVSKKFLCNHHIGMWEEATPITPASFHRSPCNRLVNSNSSSSTHNNESDSKTKDLRDRS